MKLLLEFEVRSVNMVMFFFSHIYLVGCRFRVGGDLDFPKIGVFANGYIGGRDEKGTYRIHTTR